MRVISRVGRPFYNFSLDKQEFKKGEKIDGFVLPFNVFDSVDGLFRRFGLWQSSHGVCIRGKDHRPFSIGKYTMLTDDPVLCGDAVLGSYVLESECEYMDRWGKWDCRVIYGTPPAPRAKEQHIDLLHGYADADDALATILVNLVSDLFGRILPQCLCPANGPLNTAPAMADFEAAKSRTQQEIAQKIKELREKIWK